MTGTQQLQSLITSIKYEIKTVMADTTLSLYYKIVFSILKIICVCGFNLGREYPDIRTQMPRLPPPIPTFSSNEKQSENGEADKVLRSEPSAETDCKQDSQNSSPAYAGLQELSVEGEVEQRDFRPTVVVVIPVYVRSLQQRKEVMELVTSLANQTFNPEKVLLVDDGSPLQWYKISADGNKEEDLKLPEGFRLIKCPKNRGPAAARTLGLGIAMNEYHAKIVNFVDSDCEADSHWVEAMVHAHFQELKKKTEGSDGAILSGVTYAYGNSMVGKFHDHFGTLNGRIKMNGEGLLYGPSCNLSLRICQKLLSEVGGFDESFPKAAFEDVDYCVRASKCGLLTQCVPNAKVWHKYGVSFPQLFRMFQRYGASEWAVLERHPEYMNMYGASYHIPSKAPKMA